MSGAGSFFVSVATWSGLQVSAARQPEADGMTQPGGDASSVASDAGSDATKARSYSKPSYFSKPVLNAASSAPQAEVRWWYLDLCHHSIFKARSNGPHSGHRNFKLRA